MIIFKEKFAGKRKIPIFVFAFEKTTIEHSGAVVQLVRMRACHARGRGFEPLPHRIKVLKEIQDFLLFIVEPKMFTLPYFLWQSKQQNKDDALKFRIIRVWRGCNSKEILWLNDVFDIHRNEKVIKLIKEKADGYDMELKHKADSLMQRKLR